MLQQLFPALTNAYFRAYFLAQCLSLLGSWVHNIAQSWLVLELTDSALLLGIAGAVQFLPLLLMAPFAGAVADRLPRRGLIIITQVSFLCLATTIGILTATDAIRYWHLLVLGLLLGIANAFDMPARQAFLLEMVPRQHLMNAVALNSAAFNAARMLGPAIGGWLIARWGVVPCFFINATSFVFVVAVLYGMKTATPLSYDASQQDLWEQLRAGISYIRQTPAVKWPLMLLGGLSIAAMNFHVLVPVYARMTLLAGPEKFGYLMSAAGTGSLLAALSLALLSRLGPRPAFMLGGAGLLVTAQIGLYLIPRFGSAVIFLFLAGFGMIFMAGNINSTLQLTVPPELRGRVMGFYTLLFAGVMPLGSLWSGALARLWGAPATFLVCALAGGLIILLIAPHLLSNSKSYRNTNGTN